jgi:hypothetical protein
VTPDEARHADPVVSQCRGAFDLKNVAQPSDLVDKLLNVLVRPSNANGALEKGVVGLQVFVGHGNLLFSMAWRSMA